MKKASPLADLKRLVAALDGVLLPDEQEDFEAIITALKAKPPPLAVVETQAFVMDCGLIHLPPGGRLTSTMAGRRGHYENVTVTITESKP